MKIEVSNGEIFDKLSILEVKNEKLTNKLKLEYVAKEYQYLQEVISQIDFSLQDDIYKRLRDINFSLWVSNNGQSDNSKSATTSVCRY